MFACLCVFTCAYAWMCAHVCMCVFVCVHLHVRVCACVHVALCCSVGGCGRTGGSISLLKGCEALGVLPRREMELPSPGGTEETRGCGAYGHGSGLAVLGQWLHLVVSEFFSNRNDSVYECVCAQHHLGLPCVVHMCSASCTDPACREAAQHDMQQAAALSHLAHTAPLILATVRGNVCPLLCGGAAEEVKLWSELERRGLPAAGCSTAVLCCSVWSLVAPGATWSPLGCLVDAPHLVPCDFLQPSVWVLSTTQRGPALNKSSKQTQRKANLRSSPQLSELEKC